MFEGIKKFGQKLTVESHMTERQKLESRGRENDIETLKKFGISMDELKRGESVYHVEAEDVTNEVGCGKEEVVIFKPEWDKYPHYACHRYTGKIDGGEVDVVAATAGEKLEHVFIISAFYCGERIINEKESLDLYNKSKAISNLTNDINSVHQDPDGNYTP